MLNIPKRIPDASSEIENRERKRKEYNGQKEAVHSSSSSSHANLQLRNLSNFTLDRFLSAGDTDTIACVGTFELSQEQQQQQQSQDTESKRQALVLLRRERVLEADYPLIIRSLQLTQKNQNTYYGFYDSCATHADLPQRFDCTVIFPCQQWHIEKYSAQRKIFFHETPALFQAVTLPYLRSKPASGIMWLYQLLEKQAEQDRLLLEDPDKDIGFLMYAFVPAEEFRVQVRKDPKKLRALIIVNRRDLLSLRSLNATCLPLLNNIQTKVSLFLNDLFNGNSKTGSSNDLMFFHYKPTYFHLHIHVEHFEVEVGLRDHRLLDVIENLQLDSCYYEKKTLSYSLGESDELFSRLQEYTIK